MSKSSDTVRSSDLYKELQSSLDQDRLYWIRNDAKLKAVVAAKSYDEFRDRVAAAHLTSLTRKQMNEKKPLSWNKVATLQ